MTVWHYAERILHLDLAQRDAWVEPTSLSLKRSFVGGAGFVTGLLDSGSAGRVVLAAGPLSEGMAGRLSLGAVSGSTGGMMLSSLGGRMAGALKGSGFDALVLDGELERAGVLLVSRDGVQVLDGASLSGLRVSETLRSLGDFFGPAWASLVLGPAGENLVPFATLAHEGHFAGGSGVAAALGAKRLKAVLVQDLDGVPSRCTGCTLACPGKIGGVAQVAGELGLDAPAAQRMVALAEGCAQAGILPWVSEPLTEMAHRTGVGRLLALGEEAVVSHLGPAALPVLAALPPRTRRGGVGVADLLGTCQRVWRERPGQVLREALVATQGLLARAV